MSDFISDPVLSGLTRVHETFLKREAWRNGYPANTRFDMVGTIAAKRVWSVEYYLTSLLRTFEGWECSGLTDFCLNAAVKEEHIQAFLEYGIAYRKWGIEKTRARRGSGYGI